MKLTVPRLLLAILIEIIVIVILIACVKVHASQIHIKVPPDEPPDYGPQVVMVVDHVADEKKYVVPQAVVWYKLAPLSGPTAKAPMNKGDLMICNAFDMKDQEGGMHIAERCGGDIYLVTAVGMSPLKDKK